MQHDEPLFYSVEQAARQLGIGKTLLYEQINAGQFPAVRIGRRVLVSRLALEKMAQSFNNTQK